MSHDSLNSAFFSPRALALSAVALLATVPLCADPFIDGIGDFGSTFTGPENGDLDVRQAEVSFDGSTFTFWAEVDGAVGTTTGAAYIFGLNRGAGTARFATLPADFGQGVLFDAIVRVGADGSGSFSDLLNNANNFTFSPAQIQIAGQTLLATVGVAFIPSTGFAASDYTWNLWPRSPGAGTGTISDFAPDAVNLAVSAVPEPGTVAALLGGVVLGLAAWRRRRRA